MADVPLFKVFMPPEADEMMRKTLMSGYLAEGPRVREFRDRLREYIGASYVVPMSSCTMALQISYDLAGIGAGDEVISTPLTSVATNMPFVHTGARIVWADVDPATGMTDPKRLPELITAKTKAIVFIDKDGDIASLHELRAVADAHAIPLIEDAAHAFGASYDGKKIGTISDYTCFSFQAIKQLTTGDGGVLVLQNEEDYATAKKLKWLGLDKEELAPGENAWERDISLKSYKGNMNDIAATLGLASLPHIDELHAIAKRNGAHYNELLKDMPGVTLLSRASEAESVYWTYTALFSDREKTRAALAKEGIASSRVHPRNDRYSVFKEFVRPLPGVDYFEAHELSLPCGWWVTLEDIERICNIIQKTI